MYVCHLGPVCTAWPRSGAVETGTGTWSGRSFLALWPACVARYLSRLVRHGGEHRKTKIKNCPHAWVMQSNPTTLPLELCGPGRGGQGSATWLPQDLGWVPGESACRSFRTFRSTSSLTRIRPLTSCPPSLPHARLHDGICLHAHTEDPGQGGGYQPSPAQRLFACLPAGRMYSTGRLARNMQLEAWAVLTGRVCRV